ncbi:nuclear transport factor 2 family protein [Mycobacterium sp. C31M]
MDPVAVAHRFYRALADNDGAALAGLLADDFVGEVSAGMPHDVGGTHRGRDAMILDVWARIAAIYEMQVVPSEFLTAGPDGDVAVVLGTYRGTARDERSTVHAAFAHVISVRDGQITALQQITDTARWHIPA